MNEEGPALRYFEKALEARPGDEDTQEYIDDCRRRLALPRFEKNFRERTEEAWAAFARLRGRCVKSWIPTKRTSAARSSLIETCANALKTALRQLLTL